MARIVAHPQISQLPRSDDYKKGLWLLLYDIPSENLRDLTAADRKFILDTRKMIHRQIVLTYYAVPVQQSVYRVNGEMVEPLKDAIKEWVDIYRNYPYRNDLVPLIDVQPIGLTVRDYNKWIDGEINAIYGMISDVSEFSQQTLMARPPSAAQSTYYSMKRQRDVVRELIEYDFGPKTRLGEPNPDADAKAYKKLVTVWQQASDLFDSLLSKGVILRMKADPKVAQRKKEEREKRVADAEKKQAAAFRPPPPP